MRLLKTGFVCNPIIYRQSMTQSLCIDGNFRPGLFEHFYTFQHSRPVTLNGAQSRQGCIASYVGFIFPSPAYETQAMCHYLFRLRQAISLQKQAALQDVEIANGRESLPGY